MGFGIYLKSGILVGFSILNVSCSVFGIRSEETPKHVVIQSDGDKEIRFYSPYVVAKTTVKGEFKEVQGEAFRRLAGYIFGDNEKQQKLSMTAPVAQQKSDSSQKIAMTAPVVQSSTDDGWAMTFMMPSEYKIADLPTPKDKRILLEEVPSKTFGVIRYSGLGRPSTNAEKAAVLKTWILANGKYDIMGSPVYAGYDPPWTIPFLRRNEMMFEIRARD